MTGLGANLCFAQHAYFMKKCALLIYCLFVCISQVDSFTVNIGERSFPSFKNNKLSESCWKPPRTAGFAPEMDRMSMGLFPSLQNIDLASVMSAADQVPPVAYFGYLMAAGVGVPVSEDALCIWVGTLLSKNTFTLSRKIKSVLFLYAGVVMSDMVTFGIGLAFRKGLFQPLKDKLLPESGISEKGSALARAATTVKKAGHFVGTVERFSLGIRGPVCLLCGFLGVSPLKFFSGVCLGAVGTLPIQLLVGVTLRNNPNATALITAAAVSFYAFGPAIIACCASLTLLFKRTIGKQIPLFSQTSVIVKDDVKENTEGNANELEVKENEMVIADS